MFGFKGFSEKAFELDLFPAQAAYASLKIELIDNSRLLSMPSYQPQESTPT